MAGSLVPYDEDRPVFVISVAAELSGMHAQTLRQYDRLGLVVPRRASGGGRRYSLRDVRMLREVQQLSQEGLGLEGIRRVLDLRREVEELKSEVAVLKARMRQLAEAPSAGPRIFSADRAGAVEAMPRGKARLRATGSAVMVWRPES